MIPVLVTRAEPGLSRSVAALEMAGYAPVSLPLFEVTDTGNELPADFEDHFIFTSANALEVLKRRNWHPSNEQAIAWCVGDKTAQAAREIGFVNVRSAAGGGARLVQQIADHGYESGSRFRYFTAPDRSYDVAGALGTHGHVVDTTEIYRVDLRRPTAEEFIAVMAKVKNGALFVYSKRSGDHLAGLIKENIDHVNTESMVVVAISESATNMLLNVPWRGVYASPKADETSMISRLAMVFNRP